MSRSRSALLPAAALVVAMLSGCSTDKLSIVMPVQNQRPIVRLTHYPASGTSVVSYVYELRWDGYDPDGQVVYFEYVVDPPTSAGIDTPWVRTTENRGTFTFSASHPDSDGFTARDFHVFAIRAVDNLGARSAVVARAFFAFTVAPTVQLLSPLPHDVLESQVPMNTRLTWEGSDPDGQTRTTPVRYKFKLFTRRDPAFQAIVNHPDTLRVLFAPAFAGWDSVGGDTTNTRFVNLTLGSDYVFALVAFDEAGAYTPIFSRNSNVLYFQASPAGVLSPKITLFNQFFNFTYSSGGFNTDPSAWIPLEVVPGSPVDFHWSATASAGSTINSYRWSLDIDDVSDETPRSDESTDWHHWSQWRLNSTLAEVGPFAPGETHFFYLEALDSEGERSLGIVHFSVVITDFNHDLLFVDDTRLPPDRINSSNTCTTRVPGGWPTKAELDTFFFARGGFPWRCQPANLTSPVGIFAGYHFDTISTRVQRGGLISLTLLARYRHVVWSVDRTGASYTNTPDRGDNPICNLRYMTRPNGSILLGLYAAAGGRVWLMGGGAATATQLDWDTQQPVPDDVYSSANGELAPGRFMWEVPHWRSEITARQAQQIVKSPSAAGGWPGAPDYSSLPPLLQPKSPATDPLPPNRLATEFYQPFFAAEYVSQPNTIFDVTSGGDTLATLDTLYNAAGGSLSGPLPAMTYYHGPQYSSVVFSGFPLWFFRRTQGIALADFVMQQIWGLPRDPVSRDPGEAPASPAMARRPARVPVAGMLRQRTGGVIRH